MTEDAELLRRYAEEKSEAAFAEFVQRHVNFVYACALRRVGGDAHLAEDVTQHVFTALAREAGTLARREVLSGWLYTTARNASAQVVRTERRRQTREQEAHVMSELPSADGSASDAEWQRLRPVIDAAMDQLNDDDRQAVLLRFFEGKSFADVGAKLRLTENAARMRVERALDKLHALLARHGLTSTTAALGLALANQVTVAAPSGLAASVTGAAMAGASASVAVGETFLFMSITKITLGVVVALAIGAAVYQTMELHKRDDLLLAANGTQENLLARVRALEARLSAETKRTQEAEEDSAKLLKATENLHVSQAVQAAAPITAEVVDARYKRAQELARNGNWEAALPELLWCYDEGMVRVSSYRGVRSSFLLSSIMSFASNYPPALAALKERRDQAEQRMLASTADRDAAADFATLNSTLGEDARNLEVFDKLPAGDPRRSGLLLRVYDQLIAAQRYADAAQARTFTQMNSEFDRFSPERASVTNSPNSEIVRKVSRNYVVTSTGKNIEVLAGAGELDHARALAAKLLAYDGSDETRAVVQQHAVRAGHPELLTPAK